MMFYVVPYQKRLLEAVMHCGEVLQKGVNDSSLTGPSAQSRPPLETAAVFPPEREESWGSLPFLLMTQPDGQRA